MILICKCIFVDEKGKQCGLEVSNKDFNISYDKMKEHADVVHGVKHPLDIFHIDDAIPESMKAGV